MCGQQDIRIDHVGYVQLVQRRLLQTYACLGDAVPSRRTGTVAYDAHVTCLHGFGQAVALHLGGQSAALHSLQHVGPRLSVDGGAYVKVVHARVA